MNPNLHRKHLELCSLNLNCTWSTHQFLIASLLGEIAGHVGDEKWRRGVANSRSSRVEERFCDEPMFSLIENSQILTQTFPR
jgi:hypothetical protein